MICVVGLGGFAGIFFRSFLVTVGSALAGPAFVLSLVYWVQACNVMQAFHRFYDVEVIICHFPIP
jgi:hypothetical protein